MAGNAQLDTSGNPARLLISGDWTLAHYTRLKQQTEQLVGKYDAQTAINLDDVSSIDTAGASLLVELLGAERVSQFSRDDLSGFIGEHYGPERMIVAAAGAVDHDRIGAGREGVAITPEGRTAFATYLEALGGLIGRKG